MKRFGYFLRVLIATVLLFSCKRNIEEGKGQITTKSYAVNGFTSIDVNAPVDIEIKIANVTQPTVSIKGYGNLLEKIKCEVKNGVLDISKEGIITFYTDKDIVAEVTMPALTALTIKGAADAKIIGKLAGSYFSLNVKGAGDVEIDELYTENFESSVSGAGDLTVKSGSVNFASFNVAGAGDVDAFGLQVKKMKARLSGAGDIEVSASESIDATINGAGSINYKGNPTVQSDINGIGSIEKVN